MIFKQIFSFIIFFTISFSAMQLQAAEIEPRIAGKWKITKVEFGRAYAIEPSEAKGYIGQELNQYKGSLTSPFGKCEFCGLTLNYKKQSAQELSGDYPGISFKLPNGYAIVHELTWNQGEITLIQIDKTTIYLPFNGVMFTLKNLELY